jgi:hypothetical protein
LKLKQTDIENILKKGNSSEKIDFIWNYDFKDNYDQFYFNYILQHNYKSTDHLLSAYIVDIAYYKDIRNDELTAFFIHLLQSDTNFLIKLSVLDYLKSIDFKPSQGQFEVLWNSNKHYKYIVKIELMMMGIRCCDEMYFTVNDMIEMLRKSKHYLVYIRFFKGIQNFERSKQREIYQNIHTLDKNMLKLKSVEEPYKKFMKPFKSKKYGKQ